jgi:hypothetical protein
MEGQDEQGIKREQERRTLSIYTQPTIAVAIEAVTDPTTIWTR